MEFRECYRGVCAKVLYDGNTQTFLGELVDGSRASVVEARKYEDLQITLKQAIDDHLAGRDANLAEERVRACQLEQEKVRKTDEINELVDLPFSKRRFLNFSC